MCAAASVMVCYRGREMVGNGDVCCTKRYGFLRGERERNDDVCYS